MKQVNVNSEDIEITLLLEALRLKYGYDFRGYARSSIKRRIMRRLALSGAKSISDLQHKLLHDEELSDTLLMDFSINVSEMFRDPSFYKTIREHVVPELIDIPFIKIWHAGCATGEEVYSLAILLKEQGLYGKCTIYATDFNTRVLARAKVGVYPVANIKQYTENYQLSGSIRCFDDYYTIMHDSVAMDESLKERIVFAEHNLVTDGVFSEMDMVFCRNVLIYFNKELQDRVIHLFSMSLYYGGFLCLGSKESVRFSDLSDDFEDFVTNEKIYRKKRQQE